MDTMETALSFTDEMPVFKRLEKMATYAALTPQQQMQYNDSFNNYLAYMGQQEYKLREGIKIGRAEGEKNNAISTARKMKLKGYSIDEIAELTGLTQSEINEL